MNSETSIVNFVILLTILSILTGCAADPGSRPPPVYYSGSYTAPALGAVAISPNGKLAAVANRDAIWLLDANTLVTMRVFSYSENCGSRSDWVPRYGVDNSLRFIGNEMIVSTGMFGDITIWDLKEDCPVEMLSVPELGAFPISLAWSKATGQIAVGSDNGTIVLLDPNEVGGYTHKIVDTLDGPVYDLLFSNDGTYLAAAGAHSEVLIWFVNSLERAGSLPVEGVVRNLQLVPEKRTLLVTADELVLWEFMSEKEASRLENPEMGGQKAAMVGLAILAIPMIVAAGAAGSATTPSYVVGPRISCDRIAVISPDARILADRHPGLVKETIRVIDLESNETVATLNPHGSDNCDMVFSPDGAKLLIAGRKKAALYDTTSWSQEKIKLKKPKR